MSLIKKPNAPTTATPSKQIFIESQSSVLPGFLASLSNLEADLRKDPNPKFTRSLNIHFSYKNLFSVTLFLIADRELRGVHVWAAQD